MMTNTGQHQIDGRWINQNGSILELVENEGVITGVYCSRKGRAVSGKQYPIHGVLNGDVLSFHVDWKDSEDNLESITSFSGRLQRDGVGIKAIHTVWVLVRRWENEERTKETGVWNAFLTNSDVFERLE
ncbi:MAG: avidin/streptavidin family protein [Gammaproteobacteria bacterium]|nr:avidin/streptavidin family protein [Gammaproteobacteria bacterium]